MQKTLLAAAVGTLVAASSNSFAASDAEWRAMMEQRLNYLEQRVRSQDQVIQQKNREIAALRGTKGSDGGWFQNIEVGGLVEVEASHSSTDGAPDESNIVLATVELGVASRISDWVGAEIVLLYEEDVDNDGDFNVDTAVISVADPDGSWYLNAGQMYVPFGMFASNMVSDPITLDTAETLDSALELGVGIDGISASAYLFKGDHSSEIGDYGFALNVETETQGIGVAGHLGYISNLGESDGIVDGGWFTAGNESAAWVAAAEVTAGDFTLIGEYVAANERFTDAGNQQPEIFNIEAAYAFGIMNRPASFAIGYQGTEDASHANWDLPEERIITAFSMQVADGSSVGIEYAMDEDYAGVETDTLTGQLAVEF